LKIFRFFNFDFFVNVINFFVCHRRRIEIS
jgi:hypothetical protein